MENMQIYESVRNVPETAKRAITGGRLKGKTDINPMWRIKSLTEQFGPCGIGWKYEIVKEWTEPGANGEVAAFVDINLYIKFNGEWSEAIPGTGGSMLVANESKSGRTSDECFKMALTDAISVSCKALGFGADVYWDADRTKYSDDTEMPSQKNSAPPTPKEPPLVCEMCGSTIVAVKVGSKVYSPKEIADNAKNAYSKCLCWKCCKETAQWQSQRKANG